MRSIFRDSDILCVVPLKEAKVKRGDVIVFQKDKDHIVVHRVVAINKKGWFKTQGDNVITMDQSPVKRSDILGRVEYIQRGRKRIKTWNGLLGRLVGVTFRKVTVVRRISRRFGRRCSQWLLASSLHIPLFRVFPKKLQPKVICFQTSVGEEMRLVFGGRLIGKRRAGGNWWVRLPFAIFVDSQTLPICRPQTYNRHRKSDLLETVDLHQTGFVDKLIETRLPKGESRK